MLPVRSIEHQVAASRPLPLHPLLVRSQERQVTVSRTLGGSLKEPPLHLLPVRSPECQVTVSTPHLGCSPALPPLATQPPPPVSRTVQNGFPRTHFCNIRFDSKSSRAESDNHIELGKELQPAGLTPGQEFGGG